MQQCVFFGGGVADPPQNVDVPRVHARHRFERKNHIFKVAVALFRVFSQIVSEM